MSLRLSERFDIFKKMFRKRIRYYHLKLDGLVGKCFFKQKPLGNLSCKPHTPLLSKDFSRFAYSKNSHFSQFRILPQHSDQSPATCDLKVYQDSLLYTWILDNLPLGARLLEIGGGESRIISVLKNKYEIWNLDKLEGSGFGPTQLIEKQGYHHVSDYIGAFTKELPTEYFDLVYSISTVEHFPESAESLQLIFGDIHRLLKPGGISLHAVDALLYDKHYHVHPFVTMAHANKLVLYPLVNFEKIISDKDIWLLPPFAFYTRWYHLVNKPLHVFGHPFSLNIIWQKENGESQIID